MKYFLYLIFFISANSYAYVDLNLGYTLSVRNVDGIETDDNPDPGSARQTSSGYLINLAWFMWEYTALELNYSNKTERLIDDREVATDDDTFKIKKIDSTVITEVAGVGIRQAFANRKAAIIPSLSLGYAQYSTSGSSIYTVDNSGVESDLEIEQEKQSYSSSYAAFSLRFQFTQLVGFTLSAKTVMPDFDTSQASNNVTYSAGFSWIF